MNVVGWFEFKLAYYDVTVQHVSHYAMWTLSPGPFFIQKIFGISLHITKKPFEVKDMLRFYKHFLLFLFFNFCSEYALNKSYLSFWSMMHETLCFYQDLSLGSFYLSLFHLYLLISFDFCSTNKQNPSELLFTCTVCATDAGTCRKNPCTFYLAMLMKDKFFLVKCPKYDIKLRLIVRLQFWSSWECRTSSEPLLSGPLWPGVVVMLQAI